MVLVDPHAAFQPLNFLTTFRKRGSLVTFDHSTMDPDTFERELARYPVVRGPMWQGWGAASSGTASVATATPATATPLSTAAATAAAPVTVTLPADASADFYGTLRTLLVAHGLVPDAAQADAVVAQVGKQLANFATELSLDDVELISRSLVRPTEAQASV